jgi:hypothetical protein
MPWPLNRDEIRYQAQHDAYEAHDSSARTNATVFLNFVHALFQLINTKEAARHPARPAGSLKALVIVSRVVTAGASR